MLSNFELNKLKNSFRIKKYLKGDIIFPQGAEADGAYIVYFWFSNSKKTLLQE